MSHLAESALLLCLFLGVGGFTLAMVYLLFRPLIKEQERDHAIRRERLRKRWEELKKRDLEL